jgi:hypothetical protein
LHARRAEIEQATLTRVYAISDPTETADPEYVEGLRAAVASALDYGLAAIERGEEHGLLAPTALLAQARIAARSGVSLDTVLRRYFAGYTLLGDFVMQEAESGSPGAVDLQRLLRGQARLFDRLIATVTDEYRREALIRPTSAAQRRAERVEGLLAGELLDTAELAYEFGDHHLGIIASGPGATDAINELASALDRRLLLVPRGEITWAWLGARQPPDPGHVIEAASGDWPAQLTLAIGEPGEGLAGWRLTHRQAKVALPIAQRSPRSMVRYIDVALIASVLQDEVLSSSLRTHYLAPLAGADDDGASLRETLRTYIASDRNVSSAACALGVSRRTVTKRLLDLDERLGNSLRADTPEMEIALRLHELEEVQRP